MNDIIEQLEWCYYNLSRFLMDADDLGETETVNIIKAPIIQLRITIDTLKKKQAKLRESRKRSDCFCGCSGRNCVEVYNYIKRGYAIRCGNCERITDVCKTKAEALRAWNAMQIKLKEENQNGTTV